jgi:hypothetical protein
MKISKIPEMYEVYSKLSWRFPIDNTDRKSDLERLMSIEGSFVIHSVARNGMTSLMNSLAKSNNGHVKHHYTNKEGIVTNIENEIESNVGKGLIMLDESGVIYRTLGEQSAFDYLSELSTRKRIGLRLHTNKPKDALRVQQLGEFGFEVIEIGKMPYDEFKGIFDEAFSGIDFYMPERFIRYAHTKFERFHYQLLYVTKAFKELIENPGVNFSELEMEKRTYWNVDPSGYK